MEEGGVKWPYNDPAMWIFGLGILCVVVIAVIGFWRIA